MGATGKETDRCGPRGQGRGVAIGLISLLFGLTGIAQSFAEKLVAPRAYGPDARGVFGGGRTIRLEDLPGGALRKQLEVLPAPARGKALGWLEGLQFHKNDIRSLRADPEGGIFYVCDFGGAAAEDPRPADPERPADDPPIRYAPVPVATPPIFHSKPGSTNVLFLDFNGHVVSNTIWNTTYTTAVWQCRPFDTDGDATTFSDLEQRHIRQIWERVAEDYAPFDVDVTTEQPPAWHRHTGHALITPTTDATGQRCPHYGYGGIAYVNVFGGSSYSYNAANSYSPAWVTIMSGDSYANTAEAASHELGHNMGLSHDGTATLEYYGGHAATAEAPSWGPIMGTGYGRHISQWSKGEYYGANQTQDDLVIISGKMAYQADDHGGSNSSARAVAVNGLSITATGRLGQATDRDVFSLTSGNGNIVLSVSPYRCTNGTWGGNSDLTLLLVNGAGTVLASNNFAAAAYASLTQAVAAGTYYAHVYPVAAGTPLNNPPSGYTIYGSLGQYLLTGTVAAVGNAVLLSSPQGGEMFYRSQHLAITWAAGFTNPVRIELYRGGAPQTVLATNAPNNGGYSWLVPEAQPVGTNYRIRISRADDPAVYDQSGGDFGIVPPPVTALFENFDGRGSLPAGWTQQYVSNAVSWKVQNGGGASGGSNPSSAYSGTNNAILFKNNTSANRTRLITPAMDLGGLTNVTLTFQHHMSPWSSDQDELRVYYRTNSAASWVAIAAYTSSVSAWTERIHILPNVSTQYFVAFEGVAKYGYGVCLDDVRVAGDPILEPEIPSNRLAVTSGRGNPDPAEGAHWHVQGTVIVASLRGSPTALGQTQFVCIGWAGAGSVPASGTGTNVSFALNQDSTLTWRWSTNYFFARAAESNGSIAGPAEGWYPLGGSITVTAVPDAHYELAGWSGDTQGDYQAPAMTVSMDRPRQLTACFKALLAPCGTPEPWLATYYPDCEDFDSAGLSDTDEDGLPAWKEYIAGTDPTDPDSALCLTDAGAPVNGQVILQWPVVADRYYSLYYLTNLVSGELIPLLEGRYAGAAGLMSFTNALTPDDSPRYYRIKVALE